MARRRKSLIEQIFDVSQKAKLERQREARKHERALEEAARKQLAAEVKQRRLEEQRERARARKAEQAARERAQREARLERERIAREERLHRERLKREELKAKQRERDRIRREEQAERKRAKKAERAERERERKAMQREQVTAARREKELERKAKAAELDRLAAEADLRTTQIEARMAELQGVLHLSNSDICRELKEQISGDVNVIEKVLADELNSTHQDRVGSFSLKYLPEEREAIVTYRLPPKEVIPTVASFKFLRGRKEVKPVDRKIGEIQSLYETLVAAVALRTVREVFDSAPVEVLQSIVFNGEVPTIDKATGQPDSPCIVSVNVTRDMIDAVNLWAPELDPRLALRAMNAIVSPHPYDLEPVKPVWEFDLSRYKFLQELEIVAALDSRLELLALSPGEFEHLIRNLYEKIGLKTWVTQASRDEGVDAIAVNEDPVLFGKCVIQAKRYSKVVGVEAVHALAGVMEDHKASTGILVTTSWFGKASRDFAARHGRIQLHDGRHLKSQLKEFLGLDVLISLGSVPPGTTAADRRNLG